ncbi:crossover junction endodeoxyribonuclease RuvC [Candidatus Poribacteria bacterium]|nr:crossover junction endodeoxyribonuclease RuvC [Candidatus Poribacteria bacterium]
MLVLGIDSGLANTGYGFVRSVGSKFEMVDSGNIKTAAKVPSPDRLKVISDTLDRLVELHRPQVLAIEELFFSKNVTSALAVGEARGIAKLVAANNEIPVFDYKPAEVKKAIVGYGAATKRQIQEMIKIVLNLDFIPQPDHAADALALAICHLRSRKYLELQERHTI